MTLVRLSNRESLQGRRAYHGMDDMFSWFKNEVPDFGGRNNFPSANILESNDDFKIEMMVPGYKKEDIRMEVENGVLSVSHESESGEKIEPGRFINREFQTRNFTRKFKLSDRLAADKVEASYENGILMIIIPKREEAKAKPAQKISIS